MYPLSPAQDPNAKLAYRDLDAVKSKLAAEMASLVTRYANDGLRPDLVSQAPPVVQVRRRWGGCRC